ncbi:helix-turn-helix domain-containing protein [Actinoplanes sp. GCM10030250]|uniref:helix-turn-helix domain-containing protein n=1 Tax=Actinoplanes sp. GCM10030250 TaxID=3273376 RepID=UPI00362198C6
MSEPPVEHDHGRGLLYFADGSLAYAGHYLHQDTHPDHTHSFVEIAVVVGGEGRHRSVLGPERISVGDVLLLRPGVWHGYEQCRSLDLYNCCFSVDLLHRELAWTREDPLLGYLLWTGPYAMQRRGMLTAHLSPGELAACIEHLDALDKLRAQPVEQHRGDLIGRLTLFLSVLSRSVAGEQAAAPTHPAVSHAMRLMEADLARRWTLAELAARLGLSAGYLVRLFKAATGLPPVAYLSRHRVETAANLLLHTDDPITLIAQNVGWPDQNYFARRFRAHYGLSASVYRARFTHGTVRLGATGQPIKGRDTAGAGR